MKVILNMQINIPDLNYEISEDGEFVDLQQGHLEVANISLHKIHVQLIAKLMNIQTDDKAPHEIIECLERINEQAEALYARLKAVSGDSPSEKANELIGMSEQLFKTANTALSYWA